MAQTESNVWPDLRIETSFQHSHSPGWRNEDGGGRRLMMGNCDGIEGDRANFSRGREEMNSGGCIGRVSRCERGKRGGRMGRRGRERGRQQTRERERERERDREKRGERTTSGSDAVGGELFFPSGDDGTAPGRPISAPRLLIRTRRRPIGKPFPSWA